MQPSTAMDALPQHRRPGSGRAAGSVATILLNLGSLTLILPSCGLAAVVLCFYLLTAVSWDVLLWDMVVAVSWSPMILGVALGALVCSVVLLVRFPLLLPLLLCAAGLGSTTVLWTTTGFWSEGGETGGWLVIALGLAGTVLAAVQIRRTSNYHRNPGPAMRTASTICVLLAAGLAAFAWWGLFTVAGQHAYDEMAGMVPFAAGVLSAILAVCALLARWLGRRPAASSTR